MKKIRPIKNTWYDWLINYNHFMRWKKRKKKERN